MPPPGSGYPPQPPYPPPYGQQQAPYPYPPQHQQPRTSRSHGRAVAALTLGILSIVFCWLAVLDAVLVVVALALGFTSRESELPGSPARSRTRRLSTAAIVCAGVGAVLAIAWTVFVFHVVNQCGGIDQNGQPGFRACVQRHF